MLSLGEQVQLVLNPTQIGNFPDIDFAETDLEIIGHGVNSAVYLVTTKENVVVRSSFLDRSIEQLWEELIHYRRLQKYVGEKYLPEALFIWDRTMPIKGRSGYCFTTYHPEFTPLYDLSKQEYIVLNDQLEEIILGMIKMMEETGEIVDFSGNKGRLFLNLINFRRSENVVVIDVDGIQQVIILDFGRGNFLARIPILKDLARTVFVFGLRRALKELNANVEP